VGAGAVQDVGVDLEELGAAVGVLELGGQRSDQGAGQGPEVVAALGLVGVEHGVAAGLDLAVVLGHHRPDQAVAVLEVVLQGRAVAGARHPVDLAEADAVDAVDREQLLGRADEAVAGGPGLMHPH
jgi:hypothetical protein